MSKPLRILAALLGIAVLLAAALIYMLASPAPREDESQARSDAAEESQAAVSPQDEEILPDNATRALNGTVQVSSTLGEETGSVEQRIINILKQENRVLVEDLKRQEQRLQELQIDLQLLRAQGEPDQAATDGDETAMSVENRRADEQIEDLLDASPLIQELSDPEKQIIATLSIRSYLEVMQRSRLGMAEELKQIILTRLLPDYSHCLAEGIPFVVPTPTERERLLRYLDTGEQPLLNYRHLREDYETITQECFSILIEGINQQIAAS